MAARNAEGVNTGSDAAANPAPSRVTMASTPEDDVERTS